MTRALTTGITGSYLAVMLLEMDYAVHGSMLWASN